MLQLVSWKHCYPHSEMAFSARYALALVAVFFVQGLSASKVRRSAEASTSLQEFFDNGKDQLQTISEDLIKVINAANHDEMKNLLESMSNEIEDFTKSILEELKRQYEAHGPEMSERATAVVKDVTIRLVGNLELLKSQAPGALEEASSILQRFVDTIKSTTEGMFDGTGKLAIAAGEDDGSVHGILTKISRGALSVLLNRNVLDKVQTTIKEVTKRITGS